jgi:predicted DNA-binding transcriptional regulator AlpA
MHPHQYARMCAGELDAEKRGPDCVVAPNKPGRTPQSPRAPPLDDDVLLTGAQTRARVGRVSSMCIWRWMRDPRVRFPQPIKINNRNYWRFGDLRQWQAERAAMVKEKETP